MPFMSNNQESFLKNQISKNNKQPDKKRSDYILAKQLPLPYINNLRKWISNEKKAS